VHLCCCGVEATAGQEQVRLAMCLLSAPLLCEQISGPGRSHPRSYEVLLRVARLAPPAPRRDEDAAAIAMALGEEVRGSSRWAWLLGNFVALAQAFLDRADAEAARAALAWICWVKARAPSASRTGAFPEGLAALHGPHVVRSLLANVDPQGSRSLMPVALELYFPGASPELLRAASARAYVPLRGFVDSLDLPAARAHSLQMLLASSAVGAAEQISQEALQSLAFCVPIVERLAPHVSELARCSSIATALRVLGSDRGSESSATPHFGTLQAMQLMAFSSVYTVQLQSLYDAEFFGAANPLSPAEVGRLVPFLNRLAYCFVAQWPDRSALTPFGSALRTSLTALVRALYRRQLRMPILEDASGTTGAPWWTVPEASALLAKAPVVDLGLDQAPAAQADDDASGMDVDEDGADAAAAPSSAAAQREREAQRRKARLGGDSSAREVLEAVLEEVPHVLPFQDRVALLHNVILADQDSRWGARADWARVALPQNRIRRSSLVEDGFAAFSSLNDEDALRSVFKVEFIGPDGEPESGIDGGGLFKEFMVSLGRTIFDPEFGLFAATDDWTLFPSPTAFRSHANASELYKFLGKVVGKAIYEMLLLEPQFSRVFLNRILGHTNEVDDVAALDKELHRGMRRLKEHANVEELGLTFSIAVGTAEEVDLIPNGRDVAVTRENLTRYLHVVANFRTNLQIQRHTAAFVQGLQCVIPLSWLKMFDPYELNTLISGSSAGFDVEDLRAATVYGGGYHEGSPVIQWLWTLLREHLDVEDMGRFLMFTTSCSRPPLLGFGTLFPKFCIHRVPDPDRLPTASTCANLFKLPEYRSFEALKAKVTQAIRAECGFDLS